MASEHATHAVLFGTATVAATAASTGTTDATPELFDDAPPADSASAMSDNVEFFSVSEETAPAAVSSDSKAKTTASAPAPDLGANVELF